MNGKKALPVLFAVLALVVSTLACSFGGEPGVSNIRMTTDDSRRNNCYKLFSIR